MARVRLSLLQCSRDRRADDLPEEIRLDMEFSRWFNRVGRRTRTMMLGGLLLIVVVGSTVPDFGVATAAPGDSRVEPAPINQEVQAGPWKLTVLEILIGDDAAAQVTTVGESAQSLADGFMYVAARLRAVNGGDQSLAIGGNDFAVTGASGTVQRFVDAVPPDPALDGVVGPGETKEGWVVGSAPTDEQNLL